MTTGQRIRAVRKEVGMTQAKLAAKLGVTNHNISKWETDFRNPKYETLQRIATVLGVPVTDLLTDSTSTSGKDLRGVVLCKNCSFYRPTSLTYSGFSCNHPHGIRSSWPDDFCSHGTIRSDESPHNP